jgi:hypothetical protein
VSLVALKKKLERKPFQDPPMYFLECFTMVSNAFHALRKDTMQTIFDLSAPSVLYILLGAPNHPKRNLTPFLTLLYQGHSNLGCLIQ